MTDTDIVQQVDPISDLSRMPPELVDEACLSIKRAAEHRRKLVMAAVSFTRKHDWQRFGDDSDDGKPYLEGEGAQRLCAIGLKLSIPIFATERMGDDYFVECLLECSWPRFDAKVCEIGTCDTLDKFYLGVPGDRSTYNQALERAGNNVALAKFSILGYVKKKALANATSRAVTALLGLRGLTWGDLREAGLTAEGAGAKVGYAKGATTKKTSTAKKAAWCSLAGLADLAIDSRVSISGKVGRSSQFKKYAKIDVSGDGVSVVLQLWGTTIPEWVKPGASLFCPEVKVGEYNGRQYTTNAIEEAQAEEAPAETPAEGSAEEVPS